MAHNDFKNVTLSFGIGRIRSYHISISPVPCRSDILLKPPALTRSVRFPMYASDAAMLWHLNRIALRFQKNHSSVKRAPHPHFCRLTDGAKPNEIS
jgi:hypothetical protein